MTDATVEIGTCGYRYYDPGEDWKDEYETKLQAYSDDYATVELNTTFYELPQVSTTERWRREAFEDFDFTLKAWQAMTHAWRSPTWNGQRDAVPEEHEDLVGDLRPNEAVREGWRETKKRADALDAELVVIQTPGSFGPTEEHEENMRELLSEIDRGDLTLAWEPRGDWFDEFDRVAEVCDDLNLVHVVDLLRDHPVSSHDTAYLRMHGLNEDRFDYDYDYDEDELRDLADRIADLAADHDTIYCQFNNYEKFANADRLSRILNQEYDVTVA